MLARLCPLQLTAGLHSPSGVRPLMCSHPTWTAATRSFRGVSAAARGMDSPYYTTPCSTSIPSSLCAGATTDRAIRWTELANIHTGGRPGAVPVLGWPGHSGSSLVHPDQGWTSPSSYSTVASGGRQLQPLVHSLSIQGLAIHHHVSPARFSKQPTTLGAKRPPITMVTKWGDHSSYVNPSQHQAAYPCRHQRLPRGPLAILLPHISSQKMPTCDVLPLVRPPTPRQASTHPRPN